MSPSTRDALRAQWREAGWYPDLTIGEAIAGAAEARPDDELIFAPVDGHAARVTLRELHARATDMAGALYAAGIRPGDFVVIQAPADLRSTEALVALWALGAVVVPLTATASREEVAHAISETGAAHALVAPVWRERDLAVEMRSHTDLAVISLADDLGGQPLPPLARPNPWDVACVLYTSGSTAAPKGVRHSHETLLFGLTIAPVDPGSCTLATFPAGHVASLLALLRPLTVGGTTVVMDRWSARHAAALIEEHAVTASAGTPFFLATLLDEAERSGRDISSLGRFLCGAAAVPPTLVARAEAAGIVTWRTYGSTEHPAIASGGPGDAPDKRMHTDGRVTPGNSVRLVDEFGVDVESGAEGEIIARGPKQFIGYQDPRADADAFIDETWFRTGDLARFDEDGHLVVTDRVKDIIIRGGENISAREVEDVLAAHPSVREVAVIAAPDDVWGEAVAAYVIVNREAPTLDDLVAHAQRAGLAPHKLPTRLCIVEDFPRTAAGKVRKRDLRSR